MASLDRSYYFIFRDVSNPTSGCNRYWLGDGRLTRWVTSFSEVTSYLASSPTPTSYTGLPTATSANVQKKPSSTRAVPSLTRGSERRRESQTEQLQQQCLSFGFRVNTDGMANCMLQLTAQKKQQEDQKRQRAARALYNLGTDIANPRRANAAEPVTRSVKNCVLSSDPFGRVYTFSGIACPSGYIPH